MNKDLNLKIVINGENKAGPAFGQTKNDLKGVESQLNSLKNRLTGLLAIQVGDIIRGQIGEVLRVADSYKTLSSRLKIVSDSTDEFNAAQSALFAIAQRTRGSLEGTYDVYGKLETAIKQLGGTQDQALTTTETLNQAIALTSQGAAQDAAAILQFSQALGSGVLRGDEFNSVMENSPGLAQALADGLGVPITKLREMAQAGELTADQLINALGKSADEVDAKFKQLPLTVGGATTQLKNAFTQYIGETDAATGATAKLAKIVSTVAVNIKPLAEIGLIIAEIYGAKLVLGLSQSTQGFIANAAAARAKAAADMQAHQSALALLQTEAQVAAVRVKSALSMVEENRAIVKITAGTVEETAAKKALTQAINQLHAAQAKATAANAALTNATGPAAAGVGKLEKGFNLLNNAIGAFFAWDVGQSIGQWALQFEPVRLVGVRIAEAFTIALTGVQGFFSGISLKERWDQVKQIHADYNQIAAGSTAAAQTAAQQVAQAETTKAQAIEAAALKQQQAFKVVEDATKALTASIDSEIKAQTATIEQGLSERLAAIDAMSLGEAEKDKLRVTAKLQAYQQEVALQQQASTQKLGLIDQEYAAELQQAASNAQRSAEIETQKRQAKLAVYTGLAEYYQGEVNRLSGVYATEYQLAAQAKQQLLALNQSHEQALFNIKLMGMDEQHKLQAQQAEFDRLTNEAKKEQAKGEQADQEKINRLLNDAKNLHGQITTAAGNSSSAIYKAKERETKLYQLQKAELEANAKAHEDNAARAKAAQADVAEKLQGTQAAIADISEKLNQSYALKIGIDNASLDAARATIAEITKPETKVITIQTVNGGGNAIATDAAVPGFATGTRLPGFGGGDKWPALLESGEGVANKHAMKALDNTLGPGFFDGLNAGQNPLDLLRAVLNRKPGVLKLSRGGRPEKKLSKFQAGYYDDGSKIGEGYSKAEIARAYDRANKMTMWETTGTTSSSYHQKVRLFNSQLLTHLGPRPDDVEDPGPGSMPARMPKLSTPKLSIPTPSLPSVQTAAPAPAAPAAAAVGTMTVRFQSPKNESVSGQFSQSDAAGLLRILKDSGAITA